MPHPSRRRQRTAYTPTPKPWLWLSAGLLMGGLLTLLASSHHWGFQTKKEAPKKETERTMQSAGKAQGANNSQATPPRFEFYTLLPEMEEVVLVPEPQQTLSQQSTTPPPQKKPQDEEHLPPQASPLKAAPVPSPSEAYVLQAGSFRSHTQADKRKADLALIGVEATIQTVTIDDSKTWHRVRIGPSTDLPKLHQIQQRLRKNHIESQLFKVKS